MEDASLLELYKAFRQDNATYLSSHREHSQQYITLIIAVFGGLILTVTAAVSQFKESPIFSLILLLIITIVGPLLNIKLCDQAQKLADRSYQMFLEHISIQTKLESLLGLDNSEIVQDKSRWPFEKEDTLIPPRWLEVRSYFSSEEFVNAKLKEGSNKITHDTFDMLKIVNIYLVILLLRLLTIMTNVFFIGFFCK